MDFTSDAVPQGLAASLSKIEQAEKTWLVIGDALHKLETRDSKGADGRPWHDVLREFLETQGQAVTTGHLNKVRRVTRFVRENLDHKVSDLDLTAAKVQFSALEMAERLNTLDHQAGVAALQDCIEGLSFGDMRARYEGFRESHPELLPPRQLTWMRKRSEQSTKTAPSQNKIDLPQATLESGMLETARRLSEEFVEKVWQDGYDRGRADAKLTTAENDRIISDLKVRILELEQQITKRSDQ